MSQLPDDIKYLSTHEWARLEDDGEVSVGITDFAQQELGDVVYVELPEAGTEVKAGDEIAVVESVKAASDIYAPVTGVVTAVNTDLDATPEWVNNDPYGRGYFFRIAPRDAAELDELLDAEAYAESIES